MFAVSNIIFHLNKINKSDNLDFYNFIKQCITSEINNLFAESKVYEGIRITYYSPKKEEVGIIIFLRFFGIYQTELNYRIIYDVINKIVNSYKNKLIKIPEQDYTSLISVKYFDVIKIEDTLLNLEKYYSKILENTKDKLYDIDIDIEQIINNTTKSIKENELFLKCHRTTKFHDIDIKLWETRRALACELSLTAIVMLGVTLEECLKTVLKNNYEQEIRKTQQGANFSLLSEASLKAEEKYGDLQLYHLIVALHDEKFIDDEERKHLFHIKDYIRNAFIHSDKSKIFDINRKSDVTAFKLENNRIEYVETQELSMLQMSFAQGFMQKKLADENAKIIFYEIEEYIYKISKRFWDKWK
jgi:hypothetical protein